MVIPRFIQQALNGESLTVYGDGNQSRCFLHVQDAIDAIISLANCPEAIGEVFNIGSTEEVTIYHLARLILDITSEERGANLSKKDTDQLVFIPYDQAYSVGFEDMHKRVPDVTKIRAYTGWSASMRLEEILRAIILAVE